MGSACSSPRKDAEGEKDAEDGEHVHRHVSKRLKKTTHHRSPSFDMAPSTIQAEMAEAQTMIDAYDANIKAVDERLDVVQGDGPAITWLNRSRLTRSGAFEGIPAFKDEEDYERQREEIMRCESTLAWDFRCKTLASTQDRHADRIIQALKHRDKSKIFDKAEPRPGYGGQLHPRFPGDHFLSNLDLIEKTELLKVARKMPKGAHLHIHFNACLPPQVLLDVAAKMEHMYISSDLPLTSPSHFELCEIQFLIRSKKTAAADAGPGDLFSRDYQTPTDDRPRQWMRYSQFRDQFNKKHPKISVDQWLRNKLVFNAEEAHHWLQTVDGAWNKFNGRTRMMKGLFNYSAAYKEYTRMCLEDFVRDNIQYAEIRPNFMSTNQVWTDDGEALIDNWGIMEIIVDVCTKFQEENPSFGGVKVIYCTPRSFESKKVMIALEECIMFKKKWPKWIAGFDLVGEEAEGKPLKDFIPEFLEFRKQCRKERVDIPFLFHCGETLEMGSETDGNLVDALLLKSKRIGHGFALARHPYIMEHMKRQGICLELCPISNEVLGLTPRVNGHAMYNLLANNVHCTVSSDNGTLFRSTLSHDFYQVMVGKDDMTLHGWRQLIEWSLDHACMSESERAKVRETWGKEWDGFITWVIDTYEHVLMENTAGVDGKTWADGLI